MFVSRKTHARSDFGFDASITETYVAVTGVPCRASVGPRSRVKELTN